MIAREFDARTLLICVQIDEGKVSFFAAVKQGLFAVRTVPMYKQLANEFVVATSVSTDEKNCISNPR